jgi:hypothetical protein
MARTTRTAVGTLALVMAVVGALAGCSGGHKDTPTTPTAATSSTPTPSATVAPVVKTCPLTGLPPKSGQRVNRVALAVKVDNVSEARPQAGLDHADVVFEETVEGGLTRLMAIFQCDSATTVGPIRSARTSDGDILRLLDGAVLGYSGSNDSVGASLAANSGAALISWDHTPQYFHVDPSRPAVHNVMGSTKTLLAAGMSRNKKLNAPRRLFSYGDIKLPGTAIKNAAMTWSSSANASWHRHGKVWQRTQNGTADVLADGHRVTAHNVVIMSIAVANTGLHDVLGNASPDDVVTGHGKVWLLRDGHVFRGTWSRPTRADKMVLKDKQGRILPLTPGNTWVELLTRPRTPSFS